MSERVSVIIPTYNREGLIKRSIDSVLAQTYADLVVIVIDDGSTDDTEYVVSSINDSRVKYHRLDVNEGVANARNVGVQLAETEWIAFNDSDDVWHSDKLEKQIDYLKKHPEYSVVYCGYNGYGENGNITSTPSRKDKELLEGDIFIPLLVRNTIGAPTILMRKSEFIDVGMYNTGFSCLEDWEFVLRLAKRYEIGFVDENLLDAYISENGVSSNWSNFFNMRCCMVGMYRDELLEYGLFNVVVEEIISRAKKVQLENVVEKMLVAYLKY